MGIVTVLDAIVAKLAVDEIKAYLPGLSRMVLACAVRKLPDEEQDRYREEWTADLSQVVGDISTFVYSLGFLKAAAVISINDFLIAARAAANEEQVSLASMLMKAVKYRVLFKLGIMDLRIVNWKEISESHGTFEMRPYQLSFKEWIRRIKRSLRSKKQRAVRRRFSD